VGGAAGVVLELDEFRDRVEGGERADQHCHVDDPASMVVMVAQDRERQQTDHQVRTENRQRRRAQPGEELQRHAARQPRAETQNQYQQRQKIDQAQRSELPFVE